MNTPPLGARVCHAWLRAYTSQLDDEAAVRRRAELESDLFEHATDAQVEGVSRTALSVEMLGRMLAGMAADISWRRSVRRATPVRVSQGADMTLGTKDIILVVLIAIDVGIVVTMLPMLGFGSDIGVDDFVWLGTAMLLAGALALGLWMRPRRPIPALWLIIVGAFAPSVAWYWLPPVYLLTIATIALAVMTTRRSVRVA